MGHEGAVFTLWNRHIDPTNTGLRVTMKVGKGHRVRLGCHEIGEESVSSR